MVDLQLKKLISDVIKVPEAYELVAGNKGAVYVDAIKIATPGAYLRGTLLMSGSDGFVKATENGIKTASEVCILADDVLLENNEEAYVAAYFTGEFNDTKVIFPFEEEDDDHDEIVEVVREPLRKAKIFLRNMN